MVSDTRRARSGGGTGWFLTGFTGFAGLTGLRDDGRNAKERKGGPAALNAEEREKRRHGEF